MKTPNSLKSKAKLESQFISGADESIIPSTTEDKSRQRSYSQTDNDIKSLNVLIDNAFAFKDANGESVKLTKSSALRVAIESANILAISHPELFSDILKQFGGRKR